jgi:membrane protein CcdC involved in cytochrome C biogenesis
MKDMDYVLLSTIGAIGMGTLAMFVRMKAAKKPASARKIILPPIFMSTGALMFIFPMFRVSLLQVMEALAIGMLFSILLIRTSKFEIRDRDIYLKRSKAFIYILVGLLAVRIIAKMVLSATLDVGELGGMFWILAFGMIVPWRIAMYFEYKKLHRELHEPVKPNLA